MAVRVLPAAPSAAPQTPPPPDAPASEGVDVRERVLQLVGRSEQALARAVPDTDLDAPFTADTVRALRLLAQDSLVDIAQLRELVQERDATISGLTVEVDRWRGRALEEAAHRQVDSREGHRRERELVTVLHSELIRNEALAGELAWRRLPWWRRRGHR